VLHAAKLVTVTFTGYPYEADVQAFGDWVVTSPWWTTAGADYGIDAGTHVAKVVAQATPPARATPSDVEAFLQAEMDAGTIPVPSDTGFLYVV
jgi:hypothetical protein